MEELNLKMLRKSQLKDETRSQAAPVKQSSPAIVITRSEESEESQHRQVKLPFLNDIKQLRQAEPHQPSPGPAVNTMKHSTGTPLGQDQHLGHIEARPLLNSFPFLDDIRKLRKDSTQTNKVEREDCRLNINHHNGHTESPQQRVLTMNTDSYLDKPAIPPKENGGAKEKFQNDLLKFNKEPTQSSLSVSPPTKSVRFSTVGEHKVEHRDDHRQEHRVEQRQEHRDDHRQEQRVDHSQGQRVEQRPEQRQDHDNCSKQVDATPITVGSCKSTKYKKSTKQMSSIKIDEKTNVSRLADQIIPQLNNMQKNFLGLLFFNELSQNIVDDIVAQQLLMMSGSKLSAVLTSLEPEVCFILKCEAKID